MDEKLKKFIQKITGSWKALDKKVRIIGASAAGLVVLAIIISVIVANATSTKYELLLSGLNNKDLNDVLSDVSSRNIPVKVTGNTIYVKQGAADALRMQLAEDGIPSGNLAYDIYSSGSNFAETDKDKQIKYMQQAQNRIQASIQTIPEVKQAIVTIAEGNDDTYVLEPDKKDTTASVKLTLRQGKTLSKTQVNGIVQLVSKSVSGLSAKDVTIVDSDGEALNGSPTDTDATGEQLKLKGQYEATVKAKLNNMLGQLFGDKNYNTAVNADFDFSTHSMTTASFGSGVPNYTSVSGEVTVGGDSAATGIPGANGAQSTTTYPAVGNGSGTYTSKSASTASYSVPGIQEQINSNGGTLRKLTVSVMLNARSITSGSVDVDQLRQAVANTCGTTIDNVTVGQMNFSTAPAVMSSSVSSAARFNLNFSGGKTIYIVAAAGLLLIVLASLFLVIMLKRKKKREELAQQQQLLAAQMEEAKKLEEGGKKKPAEPLKSIEESIEESATNSVKKQIEDFTDKKPELVAQILKNWLKD